MGEIEAELKRRCNEGDEEVDQLKSQLESKELWSTCTTNEVAIFHVKKVLNSGTIVPPRAICTSGRIPVEKASA